jgi:hypothetical protein
MKGSKRPRAFKRDDSLTMRIPEEDKNRLKQVARVRRRDLSSLALEYICKCLDAEFKSGVGAHLGQ